MERLEDDKLTPPSDFGIKIPPEKERALLKALSVNAEDRYQCVEEFINALRNKATRSSVHIQSDGEGGSGAGETSAGMRREEVPVKSAARRVVCPAKAKRVACYALALGAAAIIVIAITYQNSFARLNPVKSFSAPAISQPVNTSSSPVPGGVLNENSVARKAEPAKTADVVNQNSTPVKSVPAATIKKTESKEAREARLEIEKAKRELAEQKKRDADKEAIAREIKIHTGAQLGLQMLNNQ